MSSTESLRRDHELIERILRALTVTAEMLQDGRTVPSPILNQVIDFTKNFMLMCHHSKEEDALFPTLETHGMPREGGPIARMLLEHKIAKELAGNLEASAIKYIQSNDAVDLIRDIKTYVEHVSSHLMKENLRLFVMADMILKACSEKVDRELAASESSKLGELGRTRSHYEELVSKIESEIVAPR